MANNEVQLNVFDGVARQMGKPEYTVKGNKLYPGKTFNGMPPYLIKPEFVELFDSWSAAALFCQLLYWFGKGWDKGSIYKTVREMELETGLSRRNQDTAVRRLTKLGVLRVELRGIPRKRHFSIDGQALADLATKYKSDNETKELP